MTAKASTGIPFGAQQEQDFSKFHFDESAALEVPVL
jgi:hypothetical protein